MEKMLFWGWVLSGCILLSNVMGDKPNIVIFLADNIGYGDIGCFGNTTIPTPNIDKLAEEGVKLTHHLTAASVCTPSIAAFLTGRYPIRYGMVANDMRMLPWVACSSGLPPNETTIAELAKSVDYKTAIIGKWHLGLSNNHYDDHVHHPLNQGFDYYYGMIGTNLDDFGDDREKTFLLLNPHINKYLLFVLSIGIITCGFLYLKSYLGKFSIVVVFLLIFIPPGTVFLVVNNIKTLNSILMRNFEIVEQPIILETLMQRFVLEGIEFLEQRESDQSPFLLFMSWSHVHTALKTAKGVEGVSKQGSYGDSVIEMDWGIGEIMRTLKRLGFGNNTLVYFSSDYGGHFQEFRKSSEIDGGYNGVLKGGKGGDSFDGGIRVPGIVWYPDVLPPNTVINEPSMQIDMFTTFADVIAAKCPDDRVIDGKNLLRLLKGREKVSPQSLYYHYCGERLHAVRYRPRSGSKVWKLIYEIPDRCGIVCYCAGKKISPPTLYDVTTDPSESKPINVTGQPKYLDLIDRINKLVEEHQATIIPVERQFTFMKMAWKPWLQPCCNFPFCSCQDPKYANLK